MTLPSTMLFELCLDAYVLHQRTSSQAPNLLSFVAKELHFSSTLCHGAWTSAPLSAHRKTTHLLIWQQRQKCGALGRSPIECGVVGQHYETLYFHPRHRHPHSWNDSSGNSVGPA